MRFIFLFIILLPGLVNSQSDSLSRKNAFGIEAFGKSPVFGNIYYERYFLKNFSAGLSIGFLSYSKSRRKPEVSIAYSNSLYAAYQFNKKDPLKKWSKSLRSGLILLQENKISTTTQKTIDYYSEWHGFISFSFEFRPKQNFFRIEPYLLIGDDFYITEGILPWLGFSYGRML